MTRQTPSVLDQFHWEPQPEAAKLVKHLITEFKKHCPGTADIGRRMKEQTGTRFVDWVDFIDVPKGHGLAGELRRVGFTLDPKPGRAESYTHHGGIFPVVNQVDEDVMRIGLKADSVADFQAIWRIETPIDGQPFAPMRRARVFGGDHTELWVIERHGYRGFETPAPDAGRSIKAAQHLESLRRRHRDQRSEAEGFAHLNGLVDAAIKDLGRDWTCDLFFEGERQYWQRRNRAARVQKSRQDSLGLGWANHDHHTYRSSRQSFKDLIALWEKLGFLPRERFYAGAEAGWGAQVMEQPATGITTFNDVDMTPEELMGDFAHEGLPAIKNQLGTVGLWCALHGEAVLQAGMHHLECMFDWHALKDQLHAEAHIRTMDPFTTFPYLRQAFTEGEYWPVEPKRLDALLKKGLIHSREADQFRKYGAVGSHLENLERNDGYKGFNQTGVSHIIAKTDPRKMSEIGA